MNLSELVFARFMMTKFNENKVNRDNKVKREFRRIIKYFVFILHYLHKVNTCKNSQ